MVRLASKIIFFDRLADLLRKLFIGKIGIDYLYKICISTFRHQSQI